MFHLTILVLFIAAVNCYKAPHEYFVKEQICTLEANKTFAEFFSILKLNCDWVRFIDNENDMPELEKSESKIELLYDLKFTLRTSRPATSKYNRVGARFLRAFKVRSLTLSNLNLVSIDENAFAKENYALYLETLDLSHNSLTRLDAHILANLVNLQKLNLAHNSLKLSEHNFENNVYLKQLDLSYNQFNFITPNLFENLNNLESIDLRANNIHQIKACTFNRVQVNTLSRRYYPVVIDLQLNPISCNCDLFFLERHMKYNVKAKCEKPDYYNGKYLNELTLEDPSYRCGYESIEEKCNEKHSASISQRDLALIILFASLFGLFFLISCCCYCKNSSQSSKIRRLNADLQYRIEQAKPKKIYADLNALGNGKHGASDTQALI